MILFLNIALLHRATNKTVTCLVHRQLNTFLSSRRVPPWRHQVLACLSLVKETIEVRDRKNIYTSLRPHLIKADKLPTPKVSVINSQSVDINKTTENLGSRLMSKQINLCARVEGTDRGPRPRLGQVLRGHSVHRYGRSLDFTFRKGIGS